MFEPLEPHSEHSQEHVWTSFVDLLGGFIAVLLLTILVPNLIASAREAARVRDEAKRKQAGLPTYEFRQIQFDQEGRTLTLGNEAFEKDSYRLTSRIGNVLKKCQPSIQCYLGSHPDNQIVVEGHSDSLDFRPGSSIRTPVGPIDSNYALSAMRAVTAREFLLSCFGESEGGRRKFQSNVAVAGYGADRPRKGTDGPEDTRNRRVEIRFSGGDIGSFDRVAKALQMILDEIDESDS